MLASLIPEADAVRLHGATRRRRVSGPRDVAHYVMDLVRCEGLLEVRGGTEQIEDIVGVEPDMAQEGRQGEATHMGHIDALLGLCQDVHHTGGHVVQGELYVRLLLHRFTEPLDTLENHIDIVGELF